MKHRYGGRSGPRPPTACAKALAVAQVRRSKKVRPTKDFPEAQHAVAMKHRYGVRRVDGVRRSPPMRAVRRTQEISVKRSPPSPRQVGAMADEGGAGENRTLFVMS